MMLSGSFIRAETYKNAMAVLQRYLELEMGNLVCLNQTSLNFDETLAMIRSLVENKIYFFMDGSTSSLTPDLTKQLVAAGGSYFLAFSPMTEFGSLIYWDRDYFEALDPEVHCKTRYAKKYLLGASDLIDARSRYRLTCKKLLEDRGKTHLGDTPYIIIDASLFQNHLLDIGVAFPCLEMICGNPDLMLAGIRGAARAHGSDFWMSYIPECYLGKSNDQLRAKRFFNSYMASYLSGAGIILRESGSFLDRGRQYEKAEVGSIFAGYDDFDTYYNKDYENYQNVSRAFHKFAQKDERPDSGPRTSLAIVKGELDGYAGMWDRRVWGQIHGDQWEHSDIEREWNLFWEFYNRREWSDAYHEGDEDFSGHPPCGQIDIIPAEAPVENWSRYKTLVFLGWNTVTDDLYEKMKQYVTNGGKLILSLSHMRNNIKRDEEMSLFRDGDFRDLFGLCVSGPSEATVQGVRFIENLSWCSGLPVWTTYKKDLYATDPVCIDGPIQLAKCHSITSNVIACATKKFSPDPERPVIVENKLGDGSAVLICTWSTPGQMSLGSMMRTFLQAVSAGQNEDVKFSGSDRFRYAVYEEHDKLRIYILNTDADNNQDCKLTVQGVSHRLCVKACSLEVLVFSNGRYVQQDGLAFQDINNQTKEI
jgi:hypothetical protein